MNITIKEMNFGFESNIVSRAIGGEFLWGNIYALQSPITPVFNDQIGAMSEQMISFYPGTCEPKDTGIVRWQNGQVQLNRIIKIFNGVSDSTVYKGLNNENNLTQANYFNASYSNGMQFMPKIYNGNQNLDGLKVIDPSNLLYVSY